MTFSELARSYLDKAGKRRRVLEVLLEQDAHSDVVREAQELVELALKAMLRAAGIDPPKWHDVGPILLEQASAFEPEIREQLPRLAEISRWLRKEREFAFYGDVDFIPTEQYSAADAERANAESRNLEGLTRVVRSNREGWGMATIQPTLLQKLQALPPRRLAEVEAFVEFLAEREVRAVAAERLGESLAKLGSLNLPPISDEEIEAEVEAARRERAARRD